MINEFDEARWDGWFSNQMLMVRDMLKPIVDGEIERGHCLAGSREAYGGVPGKRKIKLADAQKIARHAIAAIDMAVIKFDDRTA